MKSSILSVDSKRNIKIISDLNPHVKNYSSDIDSAVWSLFDDWTFYFGALPCYYPGIALELAHPGKNSFNQLSP